MYQHGKRTKSPHSMSVFLATVVFVGILILIGWYIVHKDIGNTTAPKTNVPIVTEVGTGTGDEKLIVEETLFKMELPTNWKLQEKKTDIPNINAYIWVSTSKGADDRRLTLHIDIMPTSYKLVKMQPLTANGATFLVGNVSDDCINFANTAGQVSSTAPVPARWENVNFICDPIKNNQTIGTGTPGASIGTKLGSHTYYFYYEDYNIYPDNNILREVLQSFIAK
jgi:hypothetical protein